MAKHLVPVSVEDESGPSAARNDHSAPEQAPRWQARAWRIAAIYGVFATLWIYFSDQALSALLPDPQTLLHWSVYKGLAFVATTFLLLLVLMKQNFKAIAESYTALCEKERELQSSERQLTNILDCAMDAIVTLDEKQRVVMFNRAAEQMFSCPQSQALGQPVQQFLDGGLPAGEGNNFVLHGLRDGASFPLEASVSRTAASAPGLPTQELLTIILRDITERQAHEAEIERMRRLYAALSQVNQAIVWLPSREALFDKICDVMIEFGKLRYAWIAWYDPETQRLECAAQSGEGDGRGDGQCEGYLKSIAVHDPDSPEWHTPCAQAFRRNEPFISNDLLNDPAAAQWRDEAQKRGQRACAVLPIRLENQPCGVLSVYAQETDFFQESEVALLLEAAIDISFALDNFAREEDRRRAQAAAQSEQLFSDTMIESMPGIVYFYDERQMLLRWNKNFEFISGYSPEELQQMNPLDFFRGADKQHVQERIGDVFAHGEAFVEADFVTKENLAIPYFFTGRRVVMDGVPYLLGMGIDVSQRKAAEAALRASEERYRTTLDSILEGCQLIGFDWTYLYLNEAAALHNRRPNHELIGHRMPEAWPGIEATPLFASLRRCMEERVPFHEETEFTFLDGSSGWFDVRAQPVPEGIFVLSIDISERHNAEVALRELNENLEVKVAERTAELEDALARAEAADRIKSAFLATMSHELRTPLNSIIGFTGIILQGLAGPLNAEQAKQLGMVRTSARHLLDLINDVLDISKIEAQQLEVRAEPFDLAQSIEKVLTTVKPLAENKGLALIAGVLPTGENGEVRMVSDRRRVEQVLLNLLNNAIKFTDAGSVSLATEIIEEYRFQNHEPVTNGATDATAANDSSSASESRLVPMRAVRLRVKDTGIGIKPEDLPALFQPFQQIDTGLAREHDGTGLGLAICRRLVELMGGEISANSTWGEGSEFTVVLPLHRSTPTA